MTSTPPAYKSRHTSLMYRVELDWEKITGSPLPIEMILHVLIDRGYNEYEIAADLGVSDQTAENWLKLFGLKRQGLRGRRRAS